MRTPEFVLVESPRSTIDRGEWYVRPLNMDRPLLDVAYSAHYTLVQPRDIIASITETKSGVFVVVTQVGQAKGGRRYRNFNSSGAATTCALQWARRRFRLADSWVEEARQRDHEHLDQIGVVSGRRLSRLYAAGRIGESRTRRWFETEGQAAAYIETFRRSDPKGVERGDYYIDPPVGED